jgi:1-deoxy-D-xylulose-5-phosphate reductoisomerase
VIQPTSLVHALVRFRDGAALAHLGYPDMRMPISYALTYPERAAVEVEPLDLASGLTLDFEPVDADAFPLLGLARKAGELGGTYPCAFNAANEVAVAAFLDGRLPFLGIAEVVEETLEQCTGAPARDLDELIEADAEARSVAERGMALGTSASRGDDGKRGKRAVRRTVQESTDKHRSRGILPPSSSGGAGAGLRPAGGAAGRGGEE